MPDRPAGVTRRTGASERLFVACELDDAARAHLAPQAAALGRALHGCPVPAANLHMTLVFLGATPAADVDAIERVLRHTCRHLPATRARQLMTAGTPDHRVSGIVAAVFDDPEDRFAVIATAIADALASRWSITPVPPPFWPHVTLVRLRTAEPVPTISAPSEQTFAFDRITLYASRSASSGPAHYVPLARIALTANDRPH
jgi:2'-5' RNA ligase